MKRILLATFAIIALTGCADSIGTGYRGVELSWGKPTGHIASEGFYWYCSWCGTSYANMNVQQQTDTITTSVQSRDGQRIDVEAAVMYQLDPAKVTSVYDRLLNDYQARVVDPTLRSSIRRAIGNYVYTDIVSHQNDVLTSIDKDLRGSLEPQGISVLNVYLTKVAFDQSVQEAIEKTVTAKQELLTATVQAQQAKVEAQGAAAAQQAQHQSLTPALLQKMWIDKWDGKLPTYVTGAGASALLQIPGNH